jgi:hypothetical protein
VAEEFHFPVKGDISEFVLHRQQFSDARGHFDGAHIKVIEAAFDIRTEGAHEAVVGCAPCSRRLQDNRDAPVRVASGALAQIGRDFLPLISVPASLAKPPDV